MPTPDEIQAAQKAKEAEWDQYVATEVIAIDGVRAFNPGDPVPTSHVDRGVVSSDQVAKRTTKAAQAVIQPEG